MKAKAVTSASNRATPGSPRGVDPRGLRFSAAVTAIVLGAALLTQSAWLLGFQTAVFAVAAIFGVRRSPYAIVFTRVVRPRLSAPAELEDPRPPRFAQLVGLVFASVGLIALIAGADLLALVAIGLALAAAFLNAVFGLCLGCELYLIGTRLTHRITQRSAPGRDGGGDTDAGTASPTATNTEVSA